MKENINRILDKIDKIKSLKEFYSFIPQLAEYLCTVFYANTSTINLVFDEDNMISYFEVNNLESTKNKFLERVCILNKNHITNYDLSLHNNRFNIEVLTNRFSKGSSFRFIFEGKPYQLYNDPSYLHKLIKEKYLNPKFIEKSKKRYENNINDPKFKEEYPTFDEYLMKLVIPFKVRNKIFGYTSIDRFLPGHKPPFRNLEELASSISDVEKKLFEKITEINQKMSKTIDALNTLKKTLNSIEKPSYTYDHSISVTQLYIHFLKYLHTKRIIHLNTQDIIFLKWGALFHDIGKLGVSDNILNKPGKLTMEEFEEIKKHPEIGYELLKNLDLEDEAYYLVLHHHEKLDGSGYPYQLKNDEIHDYVRIFTIVDIFDALIKERPYKAPYKINDAFTILKSMKSQLDQKYVTLFEEYVNWILNPEIDEIDDLYLVKIQEFLKTKK